MTKKEYLQKDPIGGTHITNNSALLVLDFIHDIDDKIVYKYSWDNKIHIRTIYTTNEGHNYFRDGVRFYLDEILRY